MRICVIGLRGLPAVIGGIETHCENLYTRLAALDPELDILLLTRNGYTELGDHEFQGVRIRSLWAPAMPGVETVLHTFLALIHARLFVRPDIVHLHGIGPGFFSLLSRLFGFTTLVTHHARDFERPKWGIVGRTFLRAGEFLAAHFAQRVICVSNALRETLLARYPYAANRLITIRNGGSLVRDTGKNDSSVLEEFGLAQGGYILAVGRLEATKAFHELIEAYLLAEPADRPLVIVGSAFTEDEYSRRLMASGSDRIRFIGFQNWDALRKLYENAALFIHPSHMEGFGLVIAEALSAGAPVVASDIAAHREFELDEHSYFRPGDIPAMAGLLSQPDYSRHRSAHACELQRLNTWDGNAAKHLKLLREIAPRRSRKSAATMPARGIDVVHSARRSNRPQ